MAHITLFEEAQKLTEEAETQLEAKEFRQARILAFEAGQAAVKDYVRGFEGQGRQSSEHFTSSEASISKTLKALGLPMEIVAVCERLEQEDPNSPKNLLPARPEGDLAAERVRQARSLTRFLRAALEEPPNPAGPAGDIR